MDDLMAKIGWEGGIGGALEYGIKADKIPADAPTGLREAWERLSAAWREVEGLLPEIEPM